MAGIEVRAINRSIALGELAPEWEGLADRCSAWPCQYPGWLQAWFAAFGRGSLEVLTAWTEGSLTGVIPLLRRIGSLRSPTNWHTARFGMLAAGPEEQAALADALLRRSVPVRLSSIQEGDPTSSEVRRSAKASGYRMVRRALPPSPYLQTSGAKALWWETLSPRMRRELRRRRRKLEQRGTLVLDVRETTGRSDVFLEEGFAIEGSGWKERKGTAIRSRTQTLGFYRRMARWAAGRGVLRLAFLRLDGRPIAFDLALEDARSHYLLKTGFDRRFASFAPGQLLRREMIERAFSEGFQTYEFLGIPEPWKLAWTGTTRGREELVVLPRTVRGRLQGVVHRRVLPAARRARARWVHG